MQLHIFPSAATTSQAAASHIAKRVTSGAVKVIGLATGRTPIDLYQILAHDVAKGYLSFAAITSFNLDEYLGIGPNNPASFKAFMQRHLFDKVKFLSSHIPASNIDDTAAEAMRYEALIRAKGGIDLQLLGIGSNGHIGFNEPGSAFDSRTRAVDLSASTRAANAPDFPPTMAVPYQAITMGIGTILEAREQVLIATGASKAQALKAALRNAPDLSCPASSLQAHANLHVFVDAQAAALLD